MIRKNHYFTEQQIDELEELSKLDGHSESEHVRRAVDKYLSTKRKQWLNVSKSRS